MQNIPTKPTLLVVEDNPVITAMLQKTVKSRRGAAVEILTAGNGLEGLETARRQVPDLVLLDWMMPDYNGEWFLHHQALEPALAGVPVMVYSALCEKDLQDVLGRYPAVKKFLHKPISPSKLFEAIVPHLKGRGWSRIEGEETPPVTPPGAAPPPA